MYEVSPKPGLSVVKAAPAGAAVAGAAAMTAAETTAAPPVTNNRQFSHFLIARCPPIAKAAGMTPSRWLSRGNAVWPQDRAVPVWLLSSLRQA